MEDKKQTQQELDTIAMMTENADKIIAGIRALKDEIAALKEERSKLIKLAVTNTLKKDTEIQSLKATLQEAGKFTEWMCHKISATQIDLWSDKREWAYKTDAAIKEALAGKA